jgi:hypothetical protein
LRASVTGALPKKALARSNALKSLHADRYPRIRFRANDIDETGDGYRLRLTWQRLADSGNTSLRAVVHAAAVEAESVHKPPGLARGRSSTSMALNWEFDVDDTEEFMNRVAAEGDLPFTQPADSSDQRSYMRLASDNSWPPENRPTVCPYPERDET